MENSLTQMMQQSYSLDNTYASGFLVYPGYYQISEWLIVKRKGVGKKSLLPRTSIQSSLMFFD